MFAGHYGPAAAAADGRIKLWHGFVAVQFLDILWAPFVMLGVEHVRIVPHFTEANHFDLYHMPWTHSLVMAIFWSAAAGLAYQARRKTGGLVIGALVFSHWILDFIAHKPDLELWFGGPKVGLGLWDHRSLSFSVELGLVVIGFMIYLARTRAKGLAGAIAPFILMALLIAAQTVGNFGPPPADGNEAAMTAITAYAVFIALAATADALRAPKR